MTISLRLPVTGAVTQYFGENPGLYAKWGYKGHNGVDFGVAQGTPVFASADGKVDRMAFETGGYGKYVRLVHEGGEYTTYYCHLSGYAHIGVRNAVRAGDVIGYSGSTGASTGPHLHWGLAIQGKVNPGFKSYFDPLQYVGGGTPIEPGVVEPPVVAPGEQPVSAAPAGVEAKLKLVVAIDELNVRMGPGTFYEKVGVVRAGEVVEGSLVTGQEVWVKLAEGRWAAMVYYGEVYLKAVEQD